MPVCGRIWLKKKLPRPCILVGSRNTCIWLLSLAQRVAPAGRASPARALATNAAASRSAAGLRPDIDDLFVTHYIIFMHWYDSHFPKDKNRGTLSCNWIDSFRILVCDFSFSENYFDFCKFDYSKASYFFRR